MRRTLVLSLIVGVVLGLAVPGGAGEGPAQAQSSVDNSSLDLTAPAQPVPPFTPPDPAAPVTKGTPGTDLANVPLERVEPAAAPAAIPPGRQYIGAGNNLLAPWRWVAYLRMTGQPGSYCADGCRCTGFLIGPTTVIIAGHCLYDTDVAKGLGGWAVDVRVAPGKDGGAEPFGFQVEDTQLWTVQGWLDGDPEHDYGAVILDHAFAGLGGPFFPYADIAAVGIVPRLSGYPGDIPGWQQYYDDDTITDVAARIVSYEIETAGGNSGSPVWYPPDYSDPIPKVLAIHTRGVGDAACFPTDNCGTRVEDTVIANLNLWLSVSPTGAGKEVELACLPLDDPSCTGADPYAPSESADMIARFTIPHPSMQFASGLLVGFLDPDFWLEEGTYLPLGALMGRVQSDTFLGTVNRPCDDRWNLTFPMYNGTTDTSETFVVDSDHGNVMDVDPAVTDACTSTDAELPNHVDCYPDYNNVIFDPDGPGPKPPIQPLVRLSGYSKVAGADILLQFVVFDKGALADPDSGFAAPHPYSQFTADWGYPSVILLLNPSAPAAPNAINFFCSPLVTRSTLYGKSQDNPDTTVDEGGTVIRRNPAAAGTHYYHYFATTYRNADEDPWENNYDSCKFCYNYDDQFNIDSDGDMIDPCCDPNPTSDDGEDYDGDLYINGNDNCPFIYNPYPQNEGELSAPWPQDAGPRVDNVGDACEGDGQIGVGTDYVILPEASTPEDGCANDVDDDGDTLVNDGCPAKASAEGPGADCDDADAETDGECANDTDDDDDGFINDGCPNVAIDAENAITACSEESCVFVDEPDTGPDFNTCDDDGDTVVNDGCPVAGGVDDDTDGLVNDGCVAFGDDDESDYLPCNNNVDDDHDGWFDEGCDSKDDFANGTYNAALVLMAMCIGETDTDGDGWCDDDECDGTWPTCAAPSTGKLSLGSNPASAPGNDHDGDGFDNPPWAGVPVGTPPNETYPNYPYSPCTGGSTTACVDNCPISYNPSQADADSDGIGDVCDLFPNTAAAADYDGDGKNNNADPCPQHKNMDLLNTQDDDGDGLGDYCDPMPNVDFSPFGRPENIALEFELPLNDGGSRPPSDEKMGMDGLQQVCDDFIDNDEDGDADFLDDACPGSDPATWGGDRDQDGAQDSVEWWVGTDPLDDCSDDCGLTTDPPYNMAKHDAWAYDLNRDCWVNTSDMLSVPGDVDMSVAKGVVQAKPYLRRYDVEPDNWINTSDMLEFRDKIDMSLACTNP